MKEVEIWREDPEYYYCHDEGGNIVVIDKRWIKMYPDDFIVRQRYWTTDYANSRTILIRSDYDAL